MGQFSISDLENLSGIKAPTIRMWEQRHNVLRPERTATNIRTYCDADLRRLLNVATLCSRGHRISQVARLSEEELGQAVLAGSDDPHDYARQVNALLAAMLEMNEHQLTKVLTATIRQLGFETAIMYVVYPFLQRIGLLWQAGSVNPAQEHLVTNLLRQKMLVATDCLPLVAQATTKRWVLFLPEGELHELALLFMNHALRSRGHHVLYLGQNMPLNDLEVVYKTYNPHAVCCVMTALPERDNVQAYVNELARLCPESEVFLYGSQAQHQELQMPPKATRLRLMTDFLALADGQRH